MSTGIAWTDESWNPVIGCSKCSPGCDDCYAIRQSHRNTAMGSKAYLPALTIADGSEWTGEVRCLPERLDQPVRWKRPRRIFVNSMSDLFHKDVPFTFIARVFAVMARCPQHTFQILTKRPKRMAMVLNEPWFIHCLEDWLDGMPVWPLPNVWLGTSIESDKYSFRADHLRDTPAAVRWISAEPLLGPLDSLGLTDIDWVVVGGETGSNARPMDLEWAGDLGYACSWHVFNGDRRIPFFMKQLGSAHGKDHKNIETFPSYLQFREYPEVAS